MAFSCARICCGSACNCEISSSTRSIDIPASENSASATGRPSDSFLLRRHAASQRSQEARAILTRLSPRETEVARWLALGWANKAIARQLAISEHTVHVHRQHIMDKTDAGSPADLARLILRADPTGLDEAGMAAD